ncbi:MAG: LysR family transcriptional regulator [Limosilactobacillus sp.]|uniref:LysR family transcriptional regulator n=1 Tax=Limosilactobacillus sp. TaxID=2773925 RepID=UPI002700356C|nr:LysR family transcriptional regulator [Limosilactobacillus sp.]
MHIEKLRYFVDLYECRSFTKTARKNFISQASISQFITSLEKEFETPLFNRNVTPIQPTIAGKLLYNNAKLLLKQYDETKIQIKNTIENMVPRLSMAYTSLNDLKLLLPFITYLKQKHFTVNVELEKVECKDVQSYVTKGIADFGLSFGEEFSSESLSKLVVKSGTYHAIVAEGHPLFDHSIIDVSELYKYPLLMLSKESMGESFYIMRDRSLQDGYLPNIARTVDDFEEGFFYILTEDLVGFATENYNLAQLDGIVRSIPIDSKHHTYQIELAYLKDNKNRALEDFCAMLKEWLLKNAIEHK